MKKYGKMITLVTTIAVLCVAYFFYISRREPTLDSTQKAVTNQKLSNLITMDIDSDYPESPKEVVKLYARIATAYYKSELTDEQIEQLGSQARKLFDSELKGTQTDSEFYKALKQDIEDYRTNKRYISDVNIEDSALVNYKTFQGRKYASLYATFSLRENDKLTLSKTKFMLRQDSDGRWKILYWELA